MALVGSRVAFIPIGLSCQVGFQLNANRDFLSCLMREPLVYKSSFFNWTYISAPAIPGALRRLVHSPLGPGAIEVPNAYHEATMLDGHRVWFWHEKPSHLVTPDELESIRAKYEHLRGNFLALAAKPHRVFVMGSAQNNTVNEYPYRNGQMALTITDQLVRDVRATLKELFPTGSNRLIVAAKAEHLDPLMNEKVHVLPPESSEWKGSSEAWRDVFKASFPARLAYGRVRARLRPVRRLARAVLGR